jgi:hypothetical protein
MNEIVLIKRNDRNGDKIPMEYRLYIEEKVYIYKARIVKIFENKPYNRVQPLPISADTTSAKMFTRKGYKTALEDFKKNIQLQNNSLSNATPYADLNNYRISTLIGGFQSAIDRFKGDKQAYGLDIISNKQKINDIVAYINKNQSEFFTKPATEEEIEAAKNYIKEKVDKGSFYQTVVQERSDYTVTTDAMIDIGEYIPKSIVDFLSTANFKLYKDGSRLPNSVKVVNRGRPAEMSKEDYNKINNFLKRNDLTKFIAEDPLNLDLTRRRNWIRMVLLPMIKEKTNVEKVVKKKYLEKLKKA